MFTKIALVVLLSVAYTIAAGKKPAGKAPEKPTFLSEAWDDIDNDNDDHATKEELEYYFEEHGLPKDLADEAFEKADKDKSGKISKSEYLAWAKGGAAAKDGAKAPPKN